ncbi:DUF4188 domain-containing protein [Microlunatus parietis]|uniref:DUF4188 domain-containing protein n=1 Tax=Microlunatus parietis TaxID=682979 RepID=A0A7Y9I5L8_9ACTN|nr:DUF4188 domain-containing protein [Microlunatus parietis]NYE70450.1 hypothetical protein [Microlunatus parietis]
MVKIDPGRATHSYDGELIVFLIGMTINKPWRPDLWGPVFRAMPGMLRELASDPDSGMLGYRLTLEGINPTLIQYWSSLDKLYAYATKPDARHRPAWTEFNARARKAPGAVGVWHETFLVDRAESVYNQTPALGLAKATTRVPVQSKGQAARQRFAAGATRGPSDHSEPDHASA